MRSVLLLSLVVCLSHSPRAQTAAPQDASGVQRVTLYGPQAHGHDTSRALFSFKTGTFGQSWDLNYGSLYVNEDHDWFEVPAREGVRTAFLDLGAHGWADPFEVPVVEPFPKLKEGEQRTVRIDVSGADGKSASTTDPKQLPGPVPPEEDIASRHVPPNRFGDTQTYVEPPPLLPKRPAPRPRQDGVPKIDPIFVKAVVGHMYVIRVVDGDEDFYVLFRVESLVRGDNCTITWMRVPAPVANSANVN